MRDPGADGGLRHLALFYSGQDEWLAALTGFAVGVLSRGEPLFTAVPGERVGVLRDALGADAPRGGFIDMTEAGRNPGRIIPMIQAFIEEHPGQRVSYIGEPAWPSRSEAELVAAATHEALINLAFAGSQATILCPYDMAGLPPDALAEAELTHPVLVRKDESGPSAAYLGPHRLPPRCVAPLPDPPPAARSLWYRDDLRGLRALVAAQAARAGLAGDRAPDLILAVSEVAANTLRYTTSGGTLRMWHTPHEIVCQIEDPGVIANPLAGRVRPRGGEPGGHGLWLVHQVCDLVETRSTKAGTTVRMRMRLRA